MSSQSPSDNKGSRNVLWPPPSPDKSQEWQQQHQHYGQPYGQQASQRLKLTPEEMAVLQSCSKESFWYRCVPLAFGAIVATQTLVNRGILKPHPRYGALFKNMAAGLVAYFAGKISYQGECRRKIMMLENSPLAESMRKGKRGRELFQEMAMLPSSGSGGDSSMAPAAPGTDSYNPQNRDAASHMDMDTDSRKYTELNDSLRPTLDSAEKRKRVDSKNQSFTNYSDLRMQNRMDYERKMAASSGPGSQTRPPSTAPYGERPPLPPPPPSSDMYSGPSLRPSSDPPGTRHNKYGDVIE